MEDSGCVAAGVTTDGVTRDAVWAGDVVVEPVPVCPSAAPASAACAVSSCGVDEPVGAVEAGTAVTGFVVDIADVDDAAVVPACVPVPMETPPGACARAPRLVGGASSFITILVWIASTTPEALRL